MPNEKITGNPAEKPAEKVSENGAEKPAGRRDGTKADIFVFTIVGEFCFINFTIFAECHTIITVAVFDYTEIVISVIFLNSLGDG